MKDIIIFVVIERRGNIFFKIRNLNGFVDLLRLRMENSFSPINQNLGVVHKWRHTLKKWQKGSGKQFCKHVILQNTVPAGQLIHG